MDLASKFDTGAAREELKKKLKGAASSPERYKAETQSTLIGSSLADQRKKWEKEFWGKEAERRYQDAKAKYDRVKARIKSGTATADEKRWNESYKRRMGLTE